VGKFVFRMQSLLNLKIQMENSLKNELGKAVTDAIFSIIFFGIIIFGLYKFIDFRRSTFKVIRNNDTKFSDVAGMEDLKREMLRRGHLKTSQRVCGKRNTPDKRYSA